VLIIQDQGEDAKDDDDEEEEDEDDEEEDEDDGGLIPLSLCICGMLMS
jgi:hypothetical protein